MAKHSDYNADQSIDLNLTQDSLTSLAIALEHALEVHGVKVQHERVLSVTEFHPDSHIGTLVKLYQRVDAARFGRKTWNADWRALEPYASLGQKR